MSTDPTGDPANRLETWSDEVCRDLGIAPDYDLADVLDTARDVAHAVARPAAPLTAFLAGYAAARDGGGRREVERALAAVRALAERQSGPGAGT